MVLRGWDFRVVALRFEIVTQIPGFRKLVALGPAT